jgi:hypothetical protein
MIPFKTRRAKNKLKKVKRSTTVKETKREITE